MPRKGETNKLYFYSGSKGMNISRGDFVLKRGAKFQDYYEWKSTIGKGAFGNVEKWVHKKTGKEAAVKVLKKKFLADKELELIINEISIIKELDHPNILKVYEAYEDKEWLYIVTELITGGELFDEISKRQKFTEVDAAIIIQQILEAVAYWHGVKIVHKDLKPENLMLQEKENVEYVKVIDFGTAQKFDPDK